MPATSPLAATFPLNVNSFGMTKDNRLAVQHGSSVLALQPCSRARRSSRSVSFGGGGRYAVPLSMSVSMRYDAHLRDPVSLAHRSSSSRTSSH